MASTPSTITSKFARRIVSRIEPSRHDQITSRVPQTERPIQEGTMLVLSRKAGEKVMIGNSIVVTVVETRGDRVKLGFECPSEMPVHREEVYRRICEEHEAELV